MDLLAIVQHHHGIINCASECIIEGNGNSYIGGFIGRSENGANIYNSYNLTKVDTAIGSGGIIGDVYSSMVDIENTYNLGDVNAHTAGGFIGRNYSGDRINLKNIYNLGKVTTTYGGWGWGAGAFVRI